MEFLTPKEYHQLKEELETLRNIKRKEIADILKKAKEHGDISENSEFQIAKEEQAWLEGRIKELENKLNKAKIVERKSNDIIEIGSKVKLQDGSNILNFELVSSESTDPSKGKISYQSPLGKALLNKKVGDLVKIKTPQGEISYKILEIK